MSQSLEVSNLYTDSKRCQCRRNALAGMARRTAFQARQCWIIFVAGNKACCISKSVRGACRSWDQRG